MIVAALIFLVLIGAGISIYLAMGLVAAGLFVAEGDALGGFVQVIVDHLNSGTLMAVPFFVIAATFMRRGGIARVLVDAANAWIGSMRGGLALVAIAATTVFAAISGSSLATALAMGTLLIPEMLRRQYDRQFAVGVIGGAGTLGILIPPSLALIVFGVIAEQSIPKLFLAGVVPGLLQAGLFAAWVMFMSGSAPRVMQTQAGEERVSRRAATLRALPAFAIPIFTLGGIYSGLVTVSEAAALAAALAIFVSVVVYREIAVSEVLEALTESIRNCAGLILIVAFALGLAHWITVSGLPVDMLDWVSSLDLEAWQFLLIMNVVMILLGMILEVISVILITVPIVLPLLEGFGISPIHYAIILVINMELALLTPPVGLNLFVLSSISKASLAEVIRGVTPYIVMLAGLLLLITFVPNLSTALPGAFER